MWRWRFIAFSVLISLIGQTRRSTGENVQWYGTVTYRKTVTLKSSKKIPPAKSEFSVVEGGQENQTDIQTFTGTITVKGNDGKNSLAVSSNGATYKRDLSIRGRTRCSRIRGFQSFTTQETEARTASGDANVNITVNINVKANGYSISFKPPTIKATGEISNQRTTSGHCAADRPVMPAVPYETSLGTEWLKAEVGFASDKDVLVGTFTKVEGGTPDTSPDGNITNVVTREYTIGWSLGRTPNDCDCRHVDKVAKELDRATKGEEAWKHIFAWTRDLYAPAARPQSNDELNAKYVQLWSAPVSQWDTVIRQSTPAAQPTKVGGLNENGEPVISRDFRDKNCDAIITALQVHEKAHATFFYQHPGEVLLGNLLQLRAESEVVSYRAQKEFLKRQLDELAQKCN